MCWDKKESNKDITKGFSGQSNGKHPIHQTVARSVLNAVKLEYFSEDDLTRDEKAPRFVRFDW